MSEALILPPLRDWAARAIPRMARGVKPHETKRQRRFLLVHLDGVSKSDLERAISEGEMPFLASLVRSGRYQLDAAFWGAPPSTPVFEASLLYGARHPSIPGYRWFDREQKRFFQMNAPGDAAQVDERLGRSGVSLLEGGGTAYLTLFRGKAENRLSMAALTDPAASFAELKAALRGSFKSARKNPFGWGWQMAQELLHAGVDGARWGLSLLDWRHEQDFALVRVFLIAMATGLARSRAFFDMVRGAPAIYLVEPGFDEVSHRRGPDSRQARRELRRADGALASLHAIARMLPNPYDLYVVSDHGQVKTTPYELVAERSIEQALKLTHPPPLPAGFAAALGGAAKRTAVPSDPVVVEAGNLAHVYLGNQGRALSASEILAANGEVLARAVNDPRVAFVAVRRHDHAVAVTREGIFTAEELTHARLPAPLSARAVAELLRELPRLPHAGDLVLHGAPAPNGGTVGFSWEFGTHGGVTAPETDSFVLWPSDAPAALNDLAHASELHGRLVNAYLP